MMTTTEFQAILRGRLAGLWPTYNVSPGFVNMLSDELRWFPASMVDAAIMAFARDNLDDAKPKGLWPSVRSYCDRNHVHSHGLFDLDEFGNTYAARENIGLVLLAKATANNNGDLRLKDEHYLAWAGHVESRNPWPGERGCDPKVLAEMNTVKWKHAKYKDTEGEVRDCITPIPKIVYERVASRLAQGTAIEMRGDRRLEPTK